MYELPFECVQAASEDSSETLLASATSKAGSSLKCAVSTERVCAPSASKVRTQMKSQAKI